MLGTITVVQDDKKAIFIELDQPGNFKMGEKVNVSRKRSERSLKQNALYWCFLQWCVHPQGGDLQSQGHFSTDGLHQDIKEWFKDKHKHDFNIGERFSTTELDTKQFKDFLEIVDQELLVGFFGIDTSGFWSQLEQYSRQDTDDFKAWMNEQVAETPF